MNHELIHERNYKQLFGALGANGPRLFMHFIKCILLFSVVSIAALCVILFQVWVRAVGSRVRVGGFRCLVLLKVRSGKVRQGHLNWVQGLGFRRVILLKVRVQDVGFRVRVWVQGSGFRVQGLGFRCAILLQVTPTP